VGRGNSDKPRSQLIRKIDASDLVLGVRFAPSGLRSEPHRGAGQGPGDPFDRLDLLDDELPGRIDASAMSTPPSSTSAGKMVVIGSSRSPGPLHALHLHSL
jgi:hypothetical protein